MLSGAQIKQQRVGVDGLLVYSPHGLPNKFLDGMGPHLIPDSIHPHFAVFLDLFPEHAVKAQVIGLLKGDFPIDGQPALHLGLIAAQGQIAHFQLVQTRLFYVDMPGGGVFLILRGEHGAGDLLSSIQGGIRSHTVRQCDLAAERRLPRQQFNPRAIGRRSVHLRFLGPLSLQIAVFDGGFRIQGIQISPEALCAFAMRAQHARQAKYQQDQPGKSLHGTLLLYTADHSKDHSLLNFTYSKSVHPPQLPRVLRQKIPGRAPVQPPQVMGYSPPRGRMAC